MNIKPEYKQRIITALIAFLTVIFSVVGAMVADALTDIGEPPITISPIETPEAIVELGTTHFTDIEAEDITATDDVTIGSVLYPGFADLTISTAGQSLTPAYTAYALDSSAAISMTLTACTNEGQLLILIGDDANTITVNDSSLRSHDGAALSLGQYDVAMLVCQDTEWIQLVELATQ